MYVYNIYLQLMDNFSLLILGIAVRTIAIPVVSPSTSMTTARSTASATIKYWMSHEFINPNHIWPTYWSKIKKHIFELKLYVFVMTKAVLIRDCLICFIITAVLLRLKHRHFSQFFASHDLICPPPRPNT